MKSQRGIWFLFIGCVLILGCSATKQARRMWGGKFVLLGDHAALLKPGKNDRGLLYYVKGGIAKGDYTRVIFDPVKFSRPINLTSGSGDFKNVQKLADNFQVYMHNELATNFEVVQEPGPKTMRVQVALYHILKRGQVMNFVTGVIPTGMVVSVGKDFAGGKPAFTGEASGEILITDAQTGQVLAAGADRRVGKKYNAEFFSTWGDVNEALIHWAKQLHYRTCQVLVQEGCVKPD